VDLLPTFCDAAGIIYDQSRLDGINIMPWLRGEDTDLPHREQFWQLDHYDFYPQPGDKPKPNSTTALLIGKHKLLADSLLPVELFDLRDDPSEMKNKLDERAAFADSLSGKIKEYLAAPRMSHKSP
jgi:arylsulfatase A-like enzyme